MPNDADAVIVLDADGIIREVNGGIETLLGYRPDELLGKNAVAIRPDPSKLEVRRKDGTTFPLDISLVPLDRGTAGWFSVTLRDAEARRRADERGRLFQSLVEAAPDAIVIVDAQGLIRLANRQVTAIFGYEPAELVGKPVEVLMPARVHRSHLLHRERFATAPHHRPMGAGFELVALHKDGREFPVDISLSTLETSSGMLVSAAIRDITERKAAEDRNRIYQSLLESAAEAIIVVAANGAIRLVNRQVEAMFGYAREELIGQPVEILLPDRVKAIHSKHRAGYLAAPATRPMGAGLELFARRKDGTEFPVDISLAAIETEEGLLVSAIARDVTDLRRAEERNRLAAIVDSSNDAIFSETTDGTITSWNTAAERLYGWEASDAIGRNVAMIYPHERRDELVTMLEHIVRGERVDSLETTRVRRDGTTVEVLVSLSPISDEHGKIVGAASIARDITDRVAASRQRERLEAQLQQAQRLESVGQLAGGVAHDFNNLIAVILNYASFVLDELQDRPAVRDDVEEIRRAAERAATLTRQLLIFSRRDVIHPEVLDLRAVVVDMRKLLQRTIGENIELVTHVAEDLAPVTADRGQIEQVIVNLAVNARDAMPQGGRLVVEAANRVLDEDFVVTDPELKPGRYVRIAVADTGTGMTREVADRAFEPFFTTKPKGQGTGLGLATVYGIVKQAGGKTGLYSEPGRGTTVTIHLPAAVEGQGPGYAEPEPGQLSGQGETVLVVEDEPAVRAAARRILIQANYKVLEATGSLAALAIATDPTRRIDLMLSDVVMPDMSGVELASRIHQQREKLPVLFMSGYPQEVLAHQGLAALKLPLVEKPFTRDALLREIRKVLRPS
jgi:PAS domain S-box-containing protein